MKSENKLTAAAVNHSKSLRINRKWICDLDLGIRWTCLFMPHRSRTAAKRTSVLNTLTLIQGWFYPTKRQYPHSANSFPLFWILSTFLVPMHSLMSNVFKCKNRFVQVWDFFKKSWVLFNCINVLRKDLYSSSVNKAEWTNDFKVIIKIYNIEGSWIYDELYLFFASVK